MLREGTLMCIVCYFNIGDVHVAVVTMSIGAYILLVKPVPRRQFRGGSCSMFCGVGHVCNRSEFHLGNSLVVEGRRVQPIALVPNVAHMELHVLARPYAWLGGRHRDRS